MGGYAEVILLFNFAADGLLLFATSILLSQKVKIYRIILASIVGTVPLFLYLITGWDWLIHNAMKVISPIFMIIIAFKITGMAVLVSTIASFYFMTFLTGGILYGFQSIFFSSGTANSFSIVLYFILALSIAFYFIQRRLLSLSVKRNTLKQTVPVTFSICGNEWSGSGLIDTGNALCDPITKKEVAVCQIRPEDHWPEAIWSAEESELLALPDRWREKLAWIPARSIGAEKQLLPAFRTDQFIVLVDGKEIKTHRALVTFTKASLSDEQFFSCILHPNMVRE